MFKFIGYNILDTTVGIKFRRGRLSMGTEYACHWSTVPYSTGNDIRRLFTTVNVTKGTILCIKTGILLVNNDFGLTMIIIQLILV